MKSVITCVFLTFSNAIHFLPKGLLQLALVWLGMLFLHCRDFCSIRSDLHIRKGVFDWPYSAAQMNCSVHDNMTLKTQYYQPLAEVHWDSPSVLKRRRRLFNERGHIFMTYSCLTLSHLRLKWFLEMTTDMITQINKIKLKVGRTNVDAGEQLYFKSHNTCLVKMDHDWLDWSWRIQLDVGQKETN